MSIHSDVLLAAERIRPHVRRTPVELSASLGLAGNCRVHLKLECYQQTGSFKLRGAYNKLLSLDPELRARGVIAASTGNHGSAVAHAASQLGCPALIYVPENADTGKLDRIRELGAEIEFAGDDCVTSESRARERAEREARQYISPYNDAAVLAGQGTIGLELDQDLDALDAVFVSVGGGGLASGIGGYFAGSQRKVELIGASPSNSSAMHASLAADSITDVPHSPTLSDGTAGGLESGALTFSACRDHLREIILVSEDEIADAMRRILATHHALIEGAAGAAVAAFLQVANRYENKDVAIVLCGANVSPDVVAGVLAGR